MRLQASYFDGKTARTRQVDLLEHPAHIHVQGDDFSRVENIADVELGERLGSAPRIIRFADGAYLEIVDHPGFERWQTNMGLRDGRVDRAQRSLPLAIVSLVLVLVCGMAAYRWGFPAAAKTLAAKVPPSVSSELSERTLSLLDQRILKPSALRAARQQALLERFRQLDPDRGARLLFRGGGRLGANALALPDGTIILLDELVDLADNDDQVLGVLAHEMAHAEQNHGLQALIESTAVGAFLAWWAGDFSPLIATAPAALLQARHSRKLESEADMIAAEKLARMGIDPARLAEMLEKLEAQGAAPSENSERETSSAGESTEKWSDFLSSHPSTRARRDALRDFSTSDGVQASDSEANRE